MKHKQLRNIMSGGKLGISMEDIESAEGVPEGVLIANLPDEVAADVTHAEHYTDGIEDAGEAEQLAEHVECIAHDAIAGMCMGAAADTDKLVIETPEGEKLPEGSVTEALESMALAGAMRRYNISQEGIVGRHLAKHGHSYAAATNVAGAVGSSAAAVGATTVGGLVGGYVAGIFVSVLSGINLMDSGGAISRALLSVDKDSKALTAEATAISTKLANSTQRDTTVWSLQAGILSIAGKVPSVTDILATVEYLDMFTANFLKEGGQSLAHKCIPEINKAITTVGAGGSADVGAVIKNISNEIIRMDKSLVSALKLHPEKKTSVELCGGFAVGCTHITTNGFEVFYPEFIRSERNVRKTGGASMVVKVPNPEILKKIAAHLANIGKTLEALDGRLKSMSALNKASMDALKATKGKELTKEQAADLKKLGAMAVALLAGATKSEVQCAKHVLLICFRVMTFLNRTASKQVNKPVKEREGGYDAVITRHEPAAK